MPSGVLAELTGHATVVVIRLRSLGDTVLTTPALALLKQARPDLRIVILAERPFDELLEGNPHVSRVLAVDRKPSARARLEMLRAIRKEKPQLCLNLHGGATSAWLTALSGARFRAGFGHFRMQFSYNVKIPRAQQILSRGENEPVHTAEHHASAMFYLGVPVSEPPRAVLQAEPARRDRPYAVLHVTAAYPTKQWPADRFRRTGEFLRSHRGLEPIMVAGPGEGAVFEDLQGFTCIGDLGLRELASLLAGARLFVGNDSGPAHMAAAFGVPSVVIFGSSNSAVWRPWKTRHEVVETQWDCKPCPGDRCYAFDEPRCILSVETWPVEAAIERLLGAAAKEPVAGRAFSKNE